MLVPSELQVMTHLLYREGYSIQGSDQSFKELSNFIDFSREMYGHSPAWNLEAKGL